MTGRMLAASGALALFVAGVFVVLVVAVAGEREAARLARGSAEATAAAIELEKLVIDLQTGLRGYVIAGDPRFLEPSRRARRLLPGQSRLVRGAVASDPSQRALAERIAGRDRLVHRRLQAASRSRPSRRRRLPATPIASLRPSTT